MATVLIGGGGGLIGMRLSRKLEEAGHTVLHLSRNPDPKAPFPAYRWDVSEPYIDLEAVARADAVINLAGAGIADGRWTEKRKQEIIKSRTGTADLIQDAIQDISNPPSLYLSSSAVGYYGDRGERIMREEDPPGEGFLSESCTAWENSALRMGELGLRTVILRTGIVLSRRGGALERMAPPVRFALAPYFGKGRQWYSWIHIDDLCAMFQTCLEDPAFTGIYNAVSPAPARNRAFMETLARAMQRSALPVKVPAFALRLVFGEMAHTILDSTRVSAEKVENAGFTFTYPELLPALKDLFEG